MAKKHKLSNKEEANKYDKIINENILSLIPAILRKVVGLKDFRLQNLPILKLQTTIEREPDFLKLIYDKESPYGRILQIEFQTRNETYMAMRMLEYCSIIHRKFKKPVEQHIIFMGDKPSTMKNKIAFKGLSYQFKIHNLSEISYKEFISSDKPEEVILSILADRDDLSPQEIIDLILERLVNLKGDSTGIEKFLIQLEIISKLRNLQELTTKTIDKMSILFDITTDVRFKQGKEQGLELGATIKAIIAIRNMLKEKLITETKIIAHILDISVDFVEQTKEELKKEAAILKALSIKRARVDTIAKQFEVSPVFVRTLRKLLRKKKQ